MLTAYGTGVNACVVGFQIRFEFGSSAKPSLTSTLPVGRSDAWTVTSGHVCTADHWPTIAGSGGGSGGALDGTTSIAVTSGSSVDP